MKNRILLCVCVLALSAGAASWAMAAEAARNPGAPDIVMKGGKTGDVPFPHKAHQDALGDCAKCHELYPEESGVVEKLKAEGSLKSKAAMNECVKCHKAMAKAEEKTGPTSCKQCHAIKEQQQ